MTTPNAFISHTTKDKARFVTAFATRLRASGVAAWVDQWEIRPGDSLVDKIFEEGLKNADVVVVVLSRNSVDRPWVREELNTSVVSRIQKKTKIIPIILDDLRDEEIPVSLRSTLYVRVSDPSGYDEQFNQVRDAIFDRVTRPPLGNPPAYTAVESAALPGLTQIDSIILKLVGDLAVEEDSLVLGPHTIVKRAEGLGIGSEAATDSLFVLDRRGFLQAETDMSGDIMLLWPSIFGLQEYTRAYVSDYASLITEVAVRLVNHEENDSGTLAQSLDRPHMVVRHILNALAHEGLVELVHFDDYGSQVLRVNPELKRRLS